MTTPAETAQTKRTGIHMGSVARTLQTSMRLVDCAQFYAEHDDHHLLRIRTLRALFGLSVG
jgi:hypothetical protein